VVSEREKVGLYHRIFLLLFFDFFGGLKFVRLGSVGRGVNLSSCHVVIVVGAGGWASVVSWLVSGWLLVGFWLVSGLLLVGF